MSQTPTLDKYTNNVLPEDTPDKMDKQPWYVAGFGALGQIGSAYFGGLSQQQIVEAEEEKRKQRTLMISLIVVAIIIGVVIYVAKNKNK